MDDEALKGMKITRNTYQFNLRRRYEPTEHFRIKKSADNPIAALLFSLRGGAPHKADGKAAPHSGGLPIMAILFAAGGAFLLFLLFVAWSMSAAQANAPIAQPPAPIPEYSAQFSQQLTDLMVLSYGTQEAGQSQTYLSSKFSSMGVSSINVTGSLFLSVPARQVFVLRYPRSGADIYPQFREKLDAYLLAQGFSVSDISPSQLENIPAGSTVIIPTGYMPSFLLDAAPPSMQSYPDKAKFTPLLLSLAAGGTNVVYIGDTFNFILSPTGTPEEAPQYAVDAGGIVFDSKSRPVSSEGFRMRVPLYTAKLSTRDAHAPQQIWGSITHLKVGQGSILLLPESLDGGWADDSQAAAEDVGRLIAQMPFLPPVAQASALLNSSSINSSSIDLALTPSASSSGYLRLQFGVNDSNGLQRIFFDDYIVAKKQLGDLHFPQSAVLTPEYLGGRRADVFVALRETSSNPVKLYFELVANKSITERHELEAGFTTPIITKKSTILTNVPPGRYLLRVVDDSGKLYAATLVDVVGVDISGPDSMIAGVPIAFRDGQFNYSFSMNGQPAVVDYVRAYVKGAPATFQEFRKVSQISYAPKYTFEGSPAGTMHTIVLDFGGTFMQEYPYKKIVTRQFWDNPMVQALGVVALLVGAAGIYLRRPEKAMFQLDIPDFPPLSVTKIQVKMAVVLAIFDQINRDYSWERMPLKTEEIKSGFLKMNYNGKPIAIGDYNLERVLERLEELGHVERSLGYWGLAKWSAESGQTIGRRAIFRRLRDLCVTNAIRFSKLDVLPYCDVKLLIGQSDYFLHFFTGDFKVVSRALETIPLGRSWIIFTDHYTMEKFRNHLQSSESAALALKMEIYNNRAKLVMLDELSDLLRSMKMERQQ